MKFFGATFDFANDFEDQVEADGFKLLADVTEDEDELEEDDGFLLFAEEDDGVEEDDSFFTAAGCVNGNPTVGSSGGTTVGSFRSLPK